MDVRLCLAATHGYSFAELPPQHFTKEISKSRFKKLSHTIRHCQYNIVWTPEYRFKILKGDIKLAVQDGIRLFCKKLSCEIIELNIQPDHVHLTVMVILKVSISKLTGTLKSKTVMKVFN